MSASPTLLVHKRIWGKGVYSFQTYQRDKAADISESRIVSNIAYATSRGVARFTPCYNIVWCKANHPLALHNGVALVEALRRIPAEQDQLL